MKEIWKPIQGFEEYYLVSNKGRVKSTRFNKEKILKTSISTPGYKGLNLFKNKRSHSREVHRLVAIHFVPNPENKPEVNHKDGDKLNNHAYNLEWMTHKENFDHAYGNLFDNKGENHGNSKLTNKQVSVIKKRLSEGESYSSIAQDYPVSRHTINYIALERTWRHVDAAK